MPYQSPKKLTVVRK